MEGGNGAVVDRATLDEKQLSGEFAFLNLRLTRGLDLQAFRERFGYDLRDRHAGDLKRLFEVGLLLCDDGRLRLTRKGMLYSNEVFSIFV
jgi:oxygen-independent coproporphyrinogen-3 oxidase